LIFNVFLAYFWTKNNSSFDKFPAANSAVFGLFGLSFSFIISKALSKLISIQVLFCFNRGFFILSFLLNIGYENFANLLIFPGLFTKLFTPSVL